MPKKQLKTSPVSSTGLEASGSGVKKGTKGALCWNISHSVVSVVNLIRTSPSSLFPSLTFFLLLGGQPVVGRLPGLLILLCVIFYVARTGYNWLPASAPMVAGLWVVNPATMEIGATCSQ